MMGRPPDFIGLGAQRAGTSWIYACLYEHPAICVPIKEIHFFSRERNWLKGYDWYEGLFEECPGQARAGEFCTSYLSDPATPERIHRRYPNVRLIVSLRNPVERAYSNYLNDLMAGKVESSVSFSEALHARSGYVGRGRYATHLKRFQQLFRREQLLPLIYEDSLEEPLRFIQSIYRFIGVDSAFEPSMIRTRVNLGRVPRSAQLDALLRRASDFLRGMGLHRLWWWLKRAGLGDSLRSINTQEIGGRDQGLEPSEKEALYRLFEDEIGELERLLERQLESWRP